MANKEVRVRFAPSPTGPLHVGGLRTALFNYLFAKKSGGKFILRIEDTDKKREVSGAEKYITDSLRWCGLEPEEGPGVGGVFGPYRQSERGDIYAAHIKTLLESGKAYYAFDTEEELNKHRKDHEKKGKTFIYNWHNRLKLKNSLVLEPEEVKKKLENKEGYVIRFLSPENRTVKTVDLIRGVSSIDSSLLDDKILLKTDNSPTYHFANVVDDHLMKISHVIRGEEWLPSLALHTLLYEAFGWEEPVFAHLPLILNPNGKGKLSKRSAEKNGFPVFPISWLGEVDFASFRESGVLPQSIVNYIVTLGWSPEEGKGFLLLDELVKMFKLESVVSAGANFDYEKLKWHNHKHIQKAKNEELAKMLAELEPTAKKLDVRELTRAIFLVKERATTVLELWGLAKYLFYPPSDYNPQNLKRLNEVVLKKIVLKALEMTRSLKDGADFVEILKQWGEAENIGSGQIMMTLRVVLVGELRGVDLQEIISFVGLKEVSERIKKFIKEFI